MTAPKWKIRVFLTRLGVWETLDRARIQASLILKKPHEEDFRYFSRFTNLSGLFVDVGANAGQSALSFAIYNSNFDILSFEPNGFLEPQLRNVQKTLGGRFKYSMNGLASQRGTSTLYVPAVDGIVLTQEASFSREVLTQDLVTKTRIARATGRSDFEILRRTATIEAFDDLGLKPQIVKLDVQGYELEVLKGMTDTLSACKPLLMIENGPDLPSIQGFLQKWRYEPFRYERTLDRLVPLSQGHTPPLNVFFQIPNSNSLQDLC